jgi:hypothetical protein
MKIILGLFIITIFLIPYYAFSWGYVISEYYIWFIPEYFRQSLPNFTLLQFVGFSLFSNVLIRSNTLFIKKEYKEEYELVMMILAPWITLALGYVIYSIWFK